MERCKENCTEFIDSESVFLSAFYCAVQSHHLRSLFSRITNFANFSSTRKHPRLLHSAGRHSKTVRPTGSAIGRGRHPTETGPFRPGTATVTAKLARARRFRQSEAVRGGCRPLALPRLRAAADHPVLSRGARERADARGVQYPGLGYRVSETEGSRHRLVEYRKDHEPEQSALQRKKVYLRTHELVSNKTARWIYDQFGRVPP